MSRANSANLQRYIDDLIYRARELPAAIRSRMDENFGEFCARRQITGVSKGAKCLSRILGKRCRAYKTPDSECICQQRYPVSWIDHHDVFMTAEGPSVFVSHPYCTSTDGPRWDALRQELERQNLRLWDYGTEASFYYPGRTMQLEVAIWQPEMVEIALASK